MRNRIGALADRGSEVVAQVVDEYLVDADHQIQKRRAMAEHYPKQFGRLGRRVENRIDQIAGARSSRRSSMNTSWTRTIKSRNAGLWPNTIRNSSGAWAAASRIVSIGIFCSSA